MKKVLIALLLTYGLTSIGQNNFVFNLTDSTTKSKSEIYTATKLFIATYWKSAQAVVQNDDKEGGIILIKGIITMETTHFLSQWTFDYAYTVTFKMKDNKYKVTLDNVYCQDARIQTGKKMGKVEPCLEPNCPDNGTFENPLPGLNKIHPMMKSLHGNLFTILLDYKTFINSTKKDDW